MATGDDGDDDDDDDDDERDEWNLKKTVEFQWQGNGKRLGARAAWHMRQLPSVKLEQRHVLLGFLALSSRCWFTRFAPGFSARRLDADRRASNTVWMSPVNCDSLPSGAGPAFAWLDTAWQGRASAILVRLHVLSRQGNSPGSRPVPV